MHLINLHGDLSITHDTGHGECKIRFWLITSSPLIWQDKLAKTLVYILAKGIFNTKVLLDVIIFLCLVVFATSFQLVGVHHFSVHVASTRNREWSCVPD